MASEKETGMPTIAAVANFYNEISALAGWLENVTSWADHVLLYHTGPGGERSNDGSIELATKWGVDLRFGSIDEGFGAVRTKLITMAPCEWSVIMDCDERFYPIAPLLHCTGDEAYPAVARPNLTVRQGGVYNQLAVLKSRMTPEVDAVCAIRRHWWNFHWDAPTQNFSTIQDLQLRIVRNCEHVVYDPRVKMHEQIIDRRTGKGPSFAQPTEDEGPFLDHFHLFFKAQEPEQRLHDIQIYNALHENRHVPTLHEFLNPNGILEPTGDCA